MSRANFVQVRLAAAATDIQTTLSIKAPEGGLKLPPADGGRLVLTDSPGRPLAFEIISYTSRSGSGPYTLNGVTRGLEGTVGLTWDIDTFAMQTLTVGEFEDLLDLKVDKTITITAGNGLTGGGTLAANRTVTLGTPGAVTASSTNTVTATGHTHALTLSKADIGLGNADNTSDATKPVSTAQQNALNLKADASIQVIAGTGLSGGGNLSANRTLSVNYGTAAGTSAQGNDSRLSNDREWTATTVSQAEAEAGTATSRRAWTAQRVRQAIVAFAAPLSRKVTAGTGLSGGGDLSADRTLSVKYGTAAGTAAQGNDSRLSDNREWTAGTVSQAEAEAGTATTRRAWTAQRVRQAITAWFNGVSGALGRTILTRTTATQVRSDIGLGTAATSDVTTSDTDTTSGRLLKVGDFGVGGRSNATSVSKELGAGLYSFSTGAESTPLSGSSGSLLAIDSGLSSGGKSFLYMLGNNATSPRAWIAMEGSNSLTPWAELYHSENFDPSTKADTSTQVIAGTGLSGGGSLSANRTLSVNYGTAAGTAAQGNDSRIVNAVPNSRQIISGTGLSGGGTLAANRTLSVNYGTAAGTAAQGNDSRIVNAVPNSRTITAGTGLSGGGTLAANRTLSVSYGTAAGTAAQGNDSRLSNSREWTASVVSQAEAEAGTATTARKWTALRVKQANAANWYLGADKQHKANATGTVTLNLATASIFDLTLTGNTTLAVSNATGTRSIVVRIRQGGTARTLAWWSGITWLASSTPAAPGANKIVEYVLSYDGSSWLGREGAKN